MIGIYNYTVYLTYVSLLSGVTGIFFAVNHRPVIAILFLMFSGLCDMFDGKVARTKKRSEHEIRFGIQIDSLADMVAFGVLPVAIGYGFGIHCILFYVISLCFVLFAMIRLAYFNVIAENSALKNEKITHYTGLPVTTTALIFPFVFLFRGLPFVTEQTFKWIYIVIVLVVGCLFVTKFKIKKPSKTQSIIMVFIGLIFVTLLILQVSKHPEIWRR